MSPQTRMSRGTNVAGGASGQGAAAFHRALRSVYDAAVRKSNAEPRRVLNPRNGHQVGVITRENGTLVFERRVQESRHRLNMFGGGWALEMALLAKLEALGAEWERIVTDTGRVLCVRLARYRERGKTINYPGFGIQLALPESCFSDRIPDDFEREHGQPDLPAATKPVEPCLFEAGDL